MITDLKTLCQRMADELDYYHIAKEGSDRSHPLACEARAALAAEPVGEGPTDTQLIEKAIAVGLAFQPQDEVSEVFLPFDAEEPLDELLVDFARAVLARWGRAGLADGPAVPEGRESASVVGEPSDEELLGIAAQAIEPYDKISLGEYEAENNCAMEVYTSELIAFARAAISRYGHQPAPPDEGELGDEDLGEPLGDLIDKWCQEGMQVKPYGTSFPLAHYVASRAYQYGLSKGHHLAPVSAEVEVQP